MSLLRSAPVSPQVVGGLAGLALLAGIFNFLKSQGGNLPFNLPF